MIAEVKRLLKLIGYAEKENDEALIQVIMDKVAADIKAATNQLAVPDEMFNDYMLAVAGEVLTIRKGSGQLDVGDLDFSLAKSISEGDTSITFNGESDSDKFNALIAYMTGAWKDKAVAFRRIAW